MTHGEPSHAQPLRVMPVGARPGGDVQCTNEFELPRYGVGPGDLFDRVDAQIGMSGPEGHAGMVGAGDRPGVGQVTDQPW